MSMVANAMRRETREGMGGARSWTSSVAACLRHRLSPLIFSSTGRRPRHAFGLSDLIVCSPPIVAAALLPCRPLATPCASSLPPPPPVFATECHAALLPGRPLGTPHTTGSLPAAARLHPDSLLPRRCLVTCRRVADRRTSSSPASLC